MKQETNKKIYSDPAALADALGSYPSIIWDLDGTIIDSMPYWDTLGRDYLQSYGVNAPAELEQITQAMSLEESAAYFREQFGINKPNDVIIQEIMAYIAHEYRDVIPAKPYAAIVIPALAKKHCRMCVVTTSDYELARAALDRLGLSSCMEQIISANDLQMNKRSGAIYEKACEMMGYEISETLICEDATYAIRAAKETSADLLAVYDLSVDRDWDQNCALADLCFRPTPGSTFSCIR